VQAKPSKVTGGTEERRNDDVARKIPARPVEDKAIDLAAAVADRPYVRNLQDQLAGHFGSQTILGQQAPLVREMGSDFVAAILEAGDRQLDQAPRTAALIANWDGNPADAALPMRFNAALHALARRGNPASLQALYRREHDDFDGAVAAALAINDVFVAQCMGYPTQTNEVGRAAAILSALMAAQCEPCLPFELLELGSSCGLNLNLAHYGYDLGGVRAGAADSPVQIAPTWRGSPPPFAPVDIVAARGVDLNPLDPGDEATVERLMSYIWADQPARLQRLEKALGLARRHPARVDRANAAPWLIEQLRTPQPEGVCRIIFHSMVLQYLDKEDRDAIVDAIKMAGARATAERPFAWISFEWTPTRDEVRLMLTRWPTGQTRHLATCHPYGAWIEWRN
jgi:hypothetical protein